MSLRPRTLTRSAALVVALLGAGGAHASSFYPGVVQTTLELEEPPVCTLCHATLAGGSGTATRPVGLALVQRGLFAQDEASLVAAIAQLESDGVDSDGDGTGDIAELRAGTDPNSDQPELPPVPAVEYGFGCGAGGADGALVVGVALAFLRYGRARRRATGARQVKGAEERVQELQEHGISVSA